jgi:peptidoglycan/LPS O-acetylase OafA/YrhL
MYLIHPQIEPTSRKIGAMLTAHLGNGGHLPALLLYIVAVYVASLLCFRLIEKPGRRCINHLGALRRRAVIMRGDC